MSAIAASQDPDDAYLTGGRQATSSHAWSQAIQALAGSSALTPRTEHLAFLTVLANLGVEGGLAFHAALARAAGASREDVASAILGDGTYDDTALAVALAAFDA